MSENDSVSSTVSSCSTMPWFCEACRAGVDNPNCELCPNFGKLIYVVISYITAHIVTQKRFVDIVWKDTFLFDVFCHCIAVTV